jgi:hypothetical protein
LLAKATDDPSLRQNASLQKRPTKSLKLFKRLKKEERKPPVTDAVVKEEKKPDQVVQPLTKPMTIKQTL